MVVIVIGSLMGATVIILTIVIIIYYCCRTKRQRRDTDDGANIRRLTYQQPFMKHSRLWQNIQGVSGRGVALPPGAPRVAPVPRNIVSSSGHLKVELSIKLPFLAVFKKAYLGHNKIGVHLLI